MNTSAEMAEITEAEWNNILFDINKGRAVLLIGPDFIQYEGKTILNYLRDELQISNESDISFYYERDGLFLFKDEPSKTRVVSNISRLYESIASSENLLNKVTQMPFPLIISLNPDLLLTQYFDSKGIIHQFQYNEGKEKKELEIPTVDYPLIYNLFGSIQDDESLILNYDDVCDLLEWTFKGNLPDKLLTFYQKARTCIFLGFQFDRWYSQLLLKILNGKSVKGQQIAIKGLYPNDSEAFIMSQFKIKFIGDQFDLLNEIFERYVGKYGSRELRDLDPSSDTTLIIKSVRQGDLTKAISMLRLKAKDTEHENEIIGIESQYNQLIRERDRTDTRDYQTNLHQIIYQIITFAKELL